MYFHAVKTSQSRLNLQLELFNGMHKLYMHVHVQRSYTHECKDACKPLFANTCKLSSIESAKDRQATTSLHLILHLSSFNLTYAILFDMVYHELICKKSQRCKVTKLDLHKPDSLPLRQKPTLLKHLKYEKYV